jgi:hypothetical protein
MILGPLKRVGCGAAQYKDIVIVACNYANIQSNFKRPYKEGISCTDCKKENCREGLCVCNKVCQNSGILDMKTCLCNCPPFTTGPECEKKLCDKTDKQYGCWGNNEM